MTSVTLSLHSQRSTEPGMGEISTGNVYAGVDVDSALNSALRFAAPADIAGATINSVILTIRSKAVELTGGPLVKFAIAANTGNLASQNLASTAESNHDFLHTDTFEFGNDPVPADSEKVTSTYSSYTLDLTASAIVSNMEDDIIVLCQHSLFTQMIGDAESGHIVFDGVGGTAPATLDLDYTPATPSGVTGDHDGTDADDTGTITGTVLVEGVSSETDASDDGTASGSAILSGSSDNTDADDAGTAAGTHYQFTASSSTTDANDSGTATGDVSATGTSDGTDADDTGSHVGSVLVSGTSTGSDSDDTGTAVGEQFGTFGDSSKSDADDTGSVVGEVSTVGSSSKSDGDDTGNAEGNVFGTFGQSSTTDATDGGTATGQVQLTGSSTTTDADDTGVATATNETFTKRGFMPQGMFIRSRFTSGMNIGA